MGGIFKAKPSPSFSLRRAPKCSITRCVHLGGLQKTLVISSITVDGKNPAPFRMPQMLKFFSTKKTPFCGILITIWLELYYRWWNFTPVTTQWPLKGQEMGEYKITSWPMTLRKDPHLVMQLTQLISTKVVPQEECFLLRLRGTSGRADHGKHHRT